MDVPENERILVFNDTKNSNKYAPYSK